MGDIRDEKFITLPRLELFKELYDSKLANKQDTLTAGANISINNNVISYSLPRYTGDTFDVHDGGSVKWHMPAEDAARLVAERPATIELFFNTSDPATYVMAKAADIEDPRGAAYTVSLGAQALMLMIMEVPQEAGDSTYNFEGNITEYVTTDTVNNLLVYDYDGTTETDERIYNKQPATVRVIIPDTGLEVFLHKTDISGTEHYYSGSTFIEQLGGWITYTIKFDFDGVDYTDEVSYYHSYSAESDLTIMTDPADMANIIRAYNQQSLSDFKENHKYGLSGDENKFRTLFITELSGEDVKDLMWGYYNKQGRLITVNGERLKFDRPASDTYRLHNSDNSIEITVVSGESSDTVTVNISEEFTYLEIIFFHYEGE